MWFLCRRKIFPDTFVSLDLVWLEHFRSITALNDIFCWHVLQNFRFDLWNIISGSSAAINLWRNWKNSRRFMISFFYTHHAFICVKNFLLNNSFIIFLIFSIFQDICFVYQNESLINSRCFWRTTFDFILELWIIPIEFEMWILIIIESRLRNDWALAFFRTW